MNKFQLIEELAKSESLSIKVAETIVNTFFGAITVGLVRGEKAEIRGLCSFKVKNYDSYLGRNPS